MYEMYCDMTPESQNNRARAVRKRLGKHIPAATNTQEIIEELPFLCNGEVDTPL
jgi:hypothetical protein